MREATGVGNTSAPTQFLATEKEKYAYRRFGEGPGLPLLVLQHFTGTLDNWDPAVTDTLAIGREVTSQVFQTKAVLTYSDSGNGSLFQFHDAFSRQAAAFFASDFPYAPY